MNFIIDFKMLLAELALTTEKATKYSIKNGTKYNGAYGVA